MILGSETELINFGKNFGEKILRKFQTDSSPVIIELIGDVGVGKTTFTRGLAEGLGVKDTVTSPSFTICKRYSFPIRSTDSKPSESFGILSHYDFYRLDEPGLLSDDLSETISEKYSVSVIEWGESIENVLPNNHPVIKINLREDETREIIMSEEIK